MASAGPAVPPASSVENPNGSKARLADKLPEEINEMKIKDEKVKFTVSVSLNSFEFLLEFHLVVHSFGF